MRIICNGACIKYKFYFSIPEDITVPVSNGVAIFNNIEIYEGSLITQNFTVNTAKFNQRYVLSNSSIDTSTIRVKVKPSESSSSTVTYKQIDNIVGVTSTSSSYYYKKLKMKDMN